jgi:hypothetical protein
MPVGMLWLSACSCWRLGLLEFRDIGDALSGFVDACGMTRLGFKLAAKVAMPGFAPAGESLSLLTKKGTQRNHPGKPSKAR